MSRMLQYRVESSAATVIRRLPVTARALAEPPAGSGLKPVLGEPGIPVVGNSFSVLHDTLGIEREWYAKYGPIHWSDAFAKRAVLALGPDAIEAVLLNRNNEYSMQGWEEFLGSFFHRGVMLLESEEHLAHRRIMQLAFGRQELIGYLDVVNPAVAQRLSMWQPREQFPIYWEAKELLLDQAIRVFVGAEPGPEATRVSRSFIDCVAAAKAYIRADVPGSQWHRGLAGRRFLEDYFRAQIPAKRRSAGKDLFSVLAGLRGSEGNERFTDEDLVNHMIFVLLAAHDTSSIVLAQLVRFLGQHSAWQERVRAESLELGRAAIEFDDQARLPSLDLVFKETLRMFPPVGNAVRKTVKDTDLLGHYIPAGTIVAANIYPTHRMEPWWSDPDRFDPERFGPVRREDKSHRMAFAPYGAGVHKCLGMFFAGMQVKAIVHQMLLRFRWRVDPAYDPPISFGTGPYPVDGLPIDLERLR